MSTASLSSIANRSRNALQRIWFRVRRLKFRQVMGIIVILKTFNPLWFLLALTVFIILLISDLREQYAPVIDQINNNYDAIVNQDLQGLQTALDGFRVAMRDLGVILGAIRSVVNGIIGFVNAIINAIAWFFGLSKIDFNIQLPIPDFGQLFQPFNDFFIHFRGLFDGIVAFFTTTKTVLINLWERFKIFVALGVLWALLSIFASMYTEVTRGLEMIRGSGYRGGGSTPGGSSSSTIPPFEGIETARLDTPPVLIVNQASVTVPVLVANQPGENPGRRRTFAYQERHLLSAQAIWPDREVPLYFQQLSDRVDASVWSQFWQSMINLGLDPSGVQMVISADTTLLGPGVQRFLPKAEVQQSVETTILTG